ncbi:MAG TPA: SAM-dependent methyltransferase, partial [Bradyrhizobium sp.]|nr:SAM-dependent methyltransferase [Bradyrhizobium sp.]
MSETTTRDHWETVYTTRDETEVSWFQDSPSPSLELIEQLRPPKQADIIDVGGGASRLADALLERG